MTGGESDARRVRLDVGYDGTAFSGWAVQPTRRTVQGELQAGIARVLRLPAAGPGSPELTVAGRTDAGVHARGQVCHVDLEVTSDDATALGRRLNRLLPDDIAVHRSAVAPPGFDARFSATARRYAYRIVDDPFAVDPLLRRFVLGWPRRLDESAMNVAASSLLGEHDFASFCKRREGATTVRTLRSLAWSRIGALLELDVVADAFCHHMVRSLVGALVAVGEGRRPPSWPAEALAVARRDAAITVVPPHGLTLEQVEYPPVDELAARAATTRSLRV